MMEGRQTYSTSEAFKRVFEIVLIIWIVLLMIGCAVGPHYKRPLINVPGEYRGKIAPDIASFGATSSVADEQWSAMFEDPVVERLVKEAIANNLDLEIAAQRVLQAQAQVGVVRSSSFLP
jgi:multidrug efflux system outer membrane protein